MIELYFWPTPNGRKITIMLEECEIDYDVKPVDIGAGDQFAPEFVRMNPNMRMPVMVDTSSGQTIFEGGAILMYLAEKAGRFLPQQRDSRYEVLQWLFWQAGGLGPMAGQISHFFSYVDEDMAYPRKRYANEYDRLLAVMDVRLRDRDYLAGELSIADFACFPWVAPYRRFGNDLDKFAHLRRWFDSLKERPGVRKGMDVGKDWESDLAGREEARAMLFGQNSKTVLKAAGAD